MIDLTPLDVRNKKGDFKKSLRGYDVEEVDIFMDLVAERLEVLVRENLTLRDRAGKLQGQVEGQEGREKAVHEALVTAQELREQMRAQAKKEADLIRREAEAGAREVLAEAARRVEWLKASFQELERKRIRFLRSFRSMLEREMDVVAVEEGREPLSELGIDLRSGVATLGEDGPGADGSPADEDLGRLSGGEREDAGEGNGPPGANAAGTGEAIRSGGPEDELLLSLDEDERTGEAR